MSTKRWLSGLVAVYPRWWRDRYGPEVLRLAEDVIVSGRSRLRVALDLAVGALDAHLRPSAMPQVTALFAERSKWLLGFAVLPWFVLVLPLLDIFSRILVRVTGAPGTAARVASDAVFASRYVYLAGMIVMLFAWSVVFDGLRVGDRHRPRRWVAAMVLVPFGPLVLVLGLDLSETWHLGSPIVASVRTALTALAWTGGPLVALGALRLAPASRYLTDRGRRITLAFAGVTLLLAACAIVSYFGADHAALRPGLFGPREREAAMKPYWVILPIGMSTAALWSIWMTHQAGRAWRTAESLGLGSDEGGHEREAPQGSLPDLLDKLLRGAGGHVPQ